MMLRSLICFLSCVFTTDGYNDAVMENIFRSIERTLQFYESNKILVTLDDVFTLRLLEGRPKFGASHIAFVCFTLNLRSTLIRRCNVAIFLLEVAVRVSLLGGFQT